MILYIEIIPVKSKSYMGHMDGEGFWCLSSQMVNPFLIADNPSSKWWFELFLECSSQELGESDPIWRACFAYGWFNRQPESCSYFPRIPPGAFFVDGNAGIKKSTNYTRWFKVTFLSPIVGGHQQPLKGSRIKLPNGSRPEELGTEPHRTLTKTNMSPKKWLFQYEIHLPTMDFQGTFVSFREENSSPFLHTNSSAKKNVADPGNDFASSCFLGF